MISADISLMNEVVAFDLRFISPNQAELYHCHIEASKQILYKPLSQKI